MDVNKYASLKLKELRSKKNISQQELAEELHVTQQQIARYENNQRKFKQDILFKLSNYFGVSIDYFFPTIEESKLDEIIIAKIKLLNDTQKQKVIDMIDIIRG